MARTVSKASDRFIRALRLRGRRPTAPSQAERIITAAKIGARHGTAARIANKKG